MAAYLTEHPKGRVPIVPIGVRLILGHQPKADGQRLAVTDGDRQTVQRIQRRVKALILPHGLERLGRDLPDAAVEGALPDLSGMKQSNSECVNEQVDEQHCQDIGCWHENLLFFRENKSAENYAGYCFVTTF